MFITDNITLIVLIASAIVAAILIGVEQIVPAPIRRFRDIGTRNG